MVRFWELMRKGSNPDPSSPRPELNDETRRGPATPEAPSEHVRVDLHHYFHIDESLARQIVGMASAQFRIINGKLEIIMAKQSDAAATLATVATALDTIGTEVDKIGTETTSLNDKVAQLTAALGDVDTTPEVDAALAAVQASASNLATKVKTVDDLVADAAPPAP